MNILLEQKLLASSLDDRDKFEIRQIFELLSDERKQVVLSTFELIEQKILQLRQALEEQQEILLWRALWNIENAIKNSRKTSIKNSSMRDIINLKNKI